MPEHLPGVFVKKSPSGARPIEGVERLAAIRRCDPVGPVAAPLMVHICGIQAQFGGLAWRCRSLRGAAYFLKRWPQR